MASIYTNVGLTCVFLLVGGSFSVLTIIHLRNSNTASSEASQRKIKKSIQAIVAMNIFNLFVILTSLGQAGTHLYLTSRNYLPQYYTTALDVIQFLDYHGMPVLQSAFNAVSFSLICSSFRVFVKRLLCIQGANANN